MMKMLNRTAPSSGAGDVDGATSKSEIWNQVQERRVEFIETALKLAAKNTPLNKFLHRFLASKNLPYLTETCLS